MTRPDMLMLRGLTIADLARALRGSGYGISNGPVFVIAPLPVRFSGNVIDLAPALLRPQAGPPHVVSIDGEI